MFQCINLFQNGQSLLLLWHNNQACTLENCLELQDFVLILIKFFWGRTPIPPFKQNYLRLHYNHNTANHLTKLRTHTPISRPPPPFSWRTQDQMVSVCLICKVHCWSFFANGCLKEQRKVLEKSLKMYLKSPWKVLEKGMSWSVGTCGNCMFFSQQINFNIGHINCTISMIRDQDLIFGMCVLVFLRTKHFHLFQNATGLMISTSLDRKHFKYQRSSLMFLVHLSHRRLWCTIVIKRWLWSVIILCQLFTILTFPLKLLNGIWPNLTRRKNLTSSITFVLCGLIRKPRRPPWPLIGWDIFNFFSATTEWKLTVARTQCPQSSLCFLGKSENQDGHPGLLFAETFWISPLQSLNRTWWQLTGSMNLMSSTKFVFFGLIGKRRWLKHFRLLLFNC